MNNTARKIFFTSFAFGPVYHGRRFWCTCTAVCQGKEDANEKTQQVHRYAVGLTNEFPKRIVLLMRASGNTVASKTPRVAKKPPFARAYAILVLPKFLLIDHLTRSSVWHHDCANKLRKTNASVIA